MEEEKGEGEEEGEEEGEGEQDQLYQHLDVNALEHFWSSCRPCSSRHLLPDLSRGGPGKLASNILSFPQNLGTKSLVRELCCVLARSELLIYISLLLLYLIK